ncbi:hypothetical protein ACFQ4K_09920 [Tistrella bauzanensis]
MDDLTGSASSTASSTTATATSRAATTSGTAAAFVQQLSDLLQSALLSLQEAEAGSPVQGGQAGQAGAGAEEMFARLDSDSDGLVTRDEFLAGKPDEVSDAQAAALWDSIAGAEAESLTETAFAEGLAAGGGPGGAGGPPPGGPPPASSDDDEDEDTLTGLYAMLDTNEDGKVSAEELAAGGKQALQAITAALSAYRNADEQATGTGTGIATATAVTA